MRKDWPVNKLKPAELSGGNDPRQNGPFALADRCIILHSWEGYLAIPATSSLKRSRTLPNCSCEDCIQERPLKWPRGAV
jgi:hypothetical protein